MVPKVDIKKPSIWFYLTSIILLFLVMEISIFISANQFYLADYQRIAASLTLPNGVISGILFFITVQISLHAAFLLLMWFITIFLSKFFRLTMAKVETLAIFVISYSLFTLFLANHYIYPNSKFAFFKTFIPLIIIKYLYFISLTGFALLVSLAIYSYAIRDAKRHYRMLSFIALVIVGTILYINFSKPPLAASPATTEKPNIFLIGIDSLRPDFVGFNGASKLLTPNLDQFLEGATVFSESMTPLARTFPSWMSILTGLHPKVSNIRTNLPDVGNFDSSLTLPNILQQYGYTTAFATDETRFSNMETRFGFNAIITPPIGFNDFFIGPLNDFPLSNLFVNTILGKYLSPYTYANRAVYTIYDPNSFLKYLDEYLKRPKDKPLFMAVHFCLPHFPYLWKETISTPHFLYNYMSTVKRADVQVSQFIEMLKKYQLLKHGIVVLLSDHGEGIFMSGDRITDPDLYVTPSQEAEVNFPEFYVKGQYNLGVNQSSGHGTDVLSLAQYHVMLAFRFYGVEGQIPNLISGRTSLLNIKPTILSILNLEMAPITNSLKDYIAGEKSHIENDKHFFIESDFTPAAIQALYPKERDILNENLQYFTVNPTTSRIIVRPDMLKMILASKQYADFYGSWALALYPLPNMTMQPILVNLVTGFWTSSLNSDFARQAPVESMLNALKDFYHDDIKDYLILT